MRKLIVLFAVTLILASCSTDENKKDNLDLKNNTEVNMDDLLKVDQNEMLVATISTNMGAMEIELFPNEAPKTVENFVGLAQKKYYDGIIFHRVIENFMIQGGDPTGTGRGGESFWGGKFNDEFSSNLRHDQAGILSMANAGPNTNGSQFFITLVPTPWLNGKHTIFGKVINGLDVLKSIGSVKTGAMDKPINDVVMTSVKVEKRNR